MSMFSNDHNVVTMMVQSYGTSSETLNEANASPNNRPRQGEKNVSFSRGLPHGVNFLRLPGDETAD